MSSMAEDVSIRKGPYRGDVSALCLVTGPNSGAHLVAGTGPHVLLFDIPAKGRKLLCSLRVFDGVRVHGMDSRPAPAADRVENTHGKESQGQDNAGQYTTVVVVHGERRVKVLTLSCFDDGEVPQLRISKALPRFNYWVVDVKLLLSSGSEINADSVLLVAVGLSNNSVSVWDLRGSACVYRVECSERCLLYSMRLWGESLEELRAASGTVFNEVLVWEPACQGPLGIRLSEINALRKGNHGFGEQTPHRAQGGNQGTTGEQDLVAEQVVPPLQRLRGHDGSIYRLMWSLDGKSLISASDDRTARVWCAKWRGENKGEKRRSDLWSMGVDLGSVLRGHGSRLWDCYLGEKFMATASEDCTCRVWAVDGRCLATLRGHKGRGIWRCVYDPQFNILVTGGADSSIKIFSLDKWIPSGKESVSRGVSQSCLTSSGQQNFIIAPPWVGVGGRRQPSGFLDSRSEYVRCLALRDAWSLYVCTNQGAVYCVDLVNQAQGQWTLIADDFEGPIVCMDVAPLQAVEVEGDHSCDDDVSKIDVVVVGDGGGVVTLMHVQRKEIGQCRCSWRCRWTAHSKRQLLGLRLCRSVRGLYIFSTDPTGGWRLWQGFVCQPQPLDSTIASRSITFGPAGEDHVVEERTSARLVAYGSGGSARILCIDLCLSSRTLVCGDKRGDLTVYSIPESLLTEKLATAEVPSLDLAQRDCAVQLHVIAVFKEAHGISAVNSVRILQSNHSKEAEIISTGSDSCICTYTLDRRAKSDLLRNSCQIHCTGVRKVPLTVVEKLENDLLSLQLKRTTQQIASGFSSDDFVLWDATAQSEIMRVKCGGWKRPHAMLVGEMPESQQCFAFVRDHVVQVHRNWLRPEKHAEACCSSSIHRSESSEATNVQRKNLSLRSHFHGKEISSVVFLQPSRCNVRNEERNLGTWMATGSEDETVIISRYAEGTDEDIEPVCTLGDHVGGSAIRALAHVAEPCVVNNDEFGSTAPYAANPTDSSPENDSYVNKKQELLISAGAKEILTCWVIEWPLDFTDIASLDLGGGADTLSDQKCQERGLGPSIHWLTSNSRQNRFTSVATASTEESLDSDRANSNEEQLPRDEHDDPSVQKGNFQANDPPDDDRRYLCLTAFATTCAKTGTAIAFVATASSNATLRFYACHVSNRSWSELAIFDYSHALVLSMASLVVPLLSETGVSRNSVIIMTGATKGDIILWNVTDLVREYSDPRALAILNDGQLLRPPRGRGSQGGRLRRKERKAGKENLKFGQGKRESTEGADATSTSVDDWVRLPTRAGDTNHLATCHNEVHQEEGNDEGEISSRMSESIDLFQAVEGHDHRADRRSKILLQPWKEIKAAHHSGINCLSVARLQKQGGKSDETMTYVLVSGGDDQALHIMVFTVETQINGVHGSNFGEDACNGSKDRSISQGDEGNPPNWSQACHIVSRDSIQSAHSSSVKGVWTDGTWAFSVGLDQRLRLWKIKLEWSDTMSVLQTKALEERRVIVIDVPEPASLHANASLDGQYHVAVVGRGLQVIHFDLKL